MAKSALKKLRSNHGAIAFLLSVLIRVLRTTLRYETVDQCGIMRQMVNGPVIWLFWHNRIILMIHAAKKFCGDRPAAVLTSPSEDGEILAGVMKRFEAESVRGSSNKRSTAALREMVRVVKGGTDMFITPDGPRGPRYQLQAGAVKLAQLSKCPLMPVHFTYKSAWTLKTWDGLVIPKPFTKVRVTFGELVVVERAADEATLESIREELQISMTAEAERSWEENTKN
ncbi:MAG: lysophospholipid acyltransferase family protein [Verrucomicrobiales bacterium]|nr:lysophospholipid acyltransferase family protein [Verrucomicrobiales bacterium]MDF1789838.1 lysophospholipid acyltransferase family protein [Verrucomicrobiales bacterium]